MRVRGIVQGVGFRPFVHGLARRLSLCGWVLNDSEGVLLEVQGEPDSVAEFRRRLHADAPPMARVMELSASEVPCRDEAGFDIRPSATLEARRTLISPDTATCADCLRELFDSADRRYRYPFINCTNCGPRYTIITDVPYDRPNTTMARFRMCPDCQREYDDPADRRFHAQPNACPVCGPKVTLLNAMGAKLVTEDPIRQTARLLHQGGILAIKGLGGFHLAVDAGNPEAVRRLRLRKNREEKPLAVMVPDLAAAEALVELSPEAREALFWPARPIVLALKRRPNPLAPEVAPHSRYFGLMLPYTPLHHLLMAERFLALVMTSGNQSDEPIAIDNAEAVHRLGRIADAFLVHDRDICLRSDDSVVRADRNAVKQMRRSRGFVPVPLAFPDGPPVLAVGPELKNTICLTRDAQAFLSQHIGDVKNLETRDFFLETIDSLTRILDVRPEIIACDMHPQYLTTQYARKRTDLRCVAVQHHHAHAAGVMAEHGLAGEVLAVVWDGTGYGTDGTTWGSEFMRARRDSFVRLGHLRYMRLPGGDRAVQEPWRMAAAGLREVLGGNWRRHAPQSLSAHAGNFDLLDRMLAREINCPASDGAGRLFDLVSALIGVCQHQTYDGQAAIELEACMDPVENGRYELPLLREGEMWVMDWRDALRAVLADLEAGTNVGAISARLHRGLVEAMAELLVHLRSETRLERVVLSGGVFQNQFLSEHAAQELGRRGFEVFEHRLVPANDGGLSLGQAAVARAVTSAKG